MKNRPLLCTCLILLAGVVLSVFAGGSALIRQLRPSPLEIRAKQGEVLARLYASDEEKLNQAVQYLNTAYEYSDTPVEPLKEIIAYVTKDGVYKQ